MASSGLHANGYSLVRALIDRGVLDLGEHGETLLTPTTIYAPHILALLEAQPGVAGIAHVTGGGLPGNLPRAIGPSLGVVVHPRAWPVPLIIETIGQLAGLDGPELRATFNGGIGMASVVAADAAADTIQLLGDRGLEAWVIGEVVAAEVAGPTRYREAE
jgi:phosphoribosylformylglycinamidine cyclo-ligase